MWLYPQPFRGVPESLLTMGEQSLYIVSAHWEACPTGTEIRWGGRGWTLSRGLHPSLGSSYPFPQPDSGGPDHMPSESQAVSTPLPSFSLPLSPKLHRTGHSRELTVGLIQPEATCPFSSSSPSCCLLPSRGKESLRQHHHTRLPPMTCTTQTDTR